MKITAIIQARMGSNRLPGKVLMKVDEKNPVLYYVIKQLQHSKLLDKIIVATTNLAEDDKIVEFVHGMGIDYFRGEPLNVLDRYYQCATKFSISTIVRITSDNPLIDPMIVDQVIEKFNSGLYDYVTTQPPRTFPQGTDVEIFSYNAVERAWKDAKKPSEKEHVTPYFYNNPTKFKIFVVKNSQNLSHLRWTIDKKTDLELVKTIFSKIKKRPIYMTDIIDLFSKEPQLVEINNDYVMNEGYLKSLKEDEDYLKSVNSEN